MECCQDRFEALQRFLFRLECDILIQKNLFRRTKEIHTRKECKKDCFADLMKRNLNLFYFLKGFPLQFQKRFFQIRPLQLCFQLLYKFLTKSGKLHLFYILKEQKNKCRYTNNKNLLNFLFYHRLKEQELFLFRRTP